MRAWRCARGERSGGSRAAAPAPTAPQEPLDRAEHRVLVHVAGDGDDELPGDVPRPVVPVDVVQPDRADRLLGAEDRRAERVALPEGAHEVLVGQVLRIVVGLADLLEDHAPFDLDVRRIERRRQDDVAEQIERLVEPRVERAAVEPGVLARRERIHVAAETVDLARDRGVRSPARPLEEQMLEEVREPLARARLGRGACAHEEAERKRAHVRHAVHQDRDAVVEDAPKDHGRAPTGSRSGAGCSAGRAGCSDRRPGRRFRCRRRRR